MLAQYYLDVPRARANRLKCLVKKVYNDLEDVLQSSRKAFLSYLLSVGLASLDKFENSLLRHPMRRRSK